MTFLMFIGTHQHTHTVQQVQDTLLPPCGGKWHKYFGKIFPVLRCHAWLSLWVRSQTHHVMSNTQCIQRKCEFWKHVYTQERRNGDIHMCMTRISFEYCTCDWSEWIISSTEHSFILCTIVTILIVSWPNPWWYWEESVQPEGQHYLYRSLWRHWLLQLSLWERDKMWNGPVNKELRSISDIGWARLQVWVSWHNVPLLTAIMAASFCTMSGGEDDEMTERSRSFSEPVESELARLCTSWIKLEKEEKNKSKVYQTHACA